MQADPRLRRIAEAADHSSGSIGAACQHAADLDGSCTCPHLNDGSFCKHLVAVGLAALDFRSDEYTAGPGGLGIQGLTVDAFVERMDVDELRKLVSDLADRQPGERRLLEVRAATASGEAAVAADELVAKLNRVLSVRGFVPYRESFGIAEDAESLLDELEGHLDDGAVDAVRPALLRALTRLRPPRLDRR